MNEIEAIVQRMIDAGESEENIAAVIKYYESQELGKQTPTAPGAVVEETVAPVSADTELVSETVSSDLPSAEVSGFESIKNSLYNIGTDFGRVADFWTGDSAALDIASAAIANSVFGEENVEEFIKENKDNKFITEGLGTEEILEKIPEREKEKQLRKPTLEIIESFKEGEFLKGGAAIASAFLNTVGSAAYGVLTAGAGYFMDYAADNYIEYNKGLAKRKGKSLEQLIQDDEADTAKPMGIAYFQAFAENTGLGKMIAPLKKEAAKSISKTIIGRQFGAKGLAVLGAARVEAGTEMFQYGAEEYNKKLGETGSQKEAAGEFVNAVFSQQGFESGLQGAFGGAGMKGARLLASSNSRPPSDVKAINQELEELTVLNKQYNLSRSPTVKEGIQNQIDEVKAKITTRVTENNDKINKLSDTQIDEINNLGDLANTQISKVQKLNEEFDEGKINRKQYNTALKGFKTAYEDSQNRINNIMLEKNIEKATQAVSEISDINVESFENAAAINEFLQQNIPGKVSQKASEQQAFIIQNRNTGKQTIVINKEIAKKDQAVTAPFHEVLHALLYKTVKGNPEAQLNLGNALSKYLNKIDVNQVKDSKYAQRLNQYKNKSAEEQAEEAITLFSDALATGDITFNENIFTKIGDVIRRTLQAAGVKVKFNTGRDVYNFVKDYNKNISEGKLSKSQIALTETKATGKLTETEAETVNEIEPQTVKEDETGERGLFDLLKAIKEAESIVKESKADIASDKVQELYDAKGVDSALEIINLFKPITNKIVQKRRDAPNFDKELLESEIEIGQRGILDLIRAYKPDSGVPLAAYINKYLPARAIEASRRILGEKFTEDVTEARGVAATEVTDDIVTQSQDKESKDARKSLRREINLNEAAVQEVRDSVKKTFGTKLPPVDSKKFKAALTKSFRNDLTKTFKNLLGTGVAYKQYLDDNFEKIFKAIPQQTLNKKFSGLFTEEVINEEGKQLREKTQIGKKVFKPKSEITKQEFIDYFTGPSVYANLANSRKTSLSQLLADEIALDATMEVIQKPEVAEKREFLDKEQKTEEVSRIIDRPIDFKFSKSLNNGLSIIGNHDSLLSIKYSKTSRKNYENILKAKRPELKDIPKQVDNLFDWINKLDVPKNKKSKYEKLALFYMGNGYLILPEDGYKVEDAIKIAANKKLDPFSFKNPNELLEKFSGVIKPKRINPDKFLNKTFLDKRRFKDGIDVYEVINTKQAQLDVRKIIDSNWGEKANPWCIAASIDGNLDEAFKYWKSYGSGKEIAFKDGKLLAFKANNQWWDRMDQPTDNLIYKLPKNKQGLREIRSLDTDSLVLNSSLNNANDVNSKFEGYIKGSKESNNYELYNKNKELTTFYKYASDKQEIFNNNIKNGLYQKWLDEDENAKFDMTFYKIVPNGIAEMDIEDYYPDPNSEFNSILPWEIVSKTNFLKSQKEVTSNRAVDKYINKGTHTFKSGKNIYKVFIDSKNKLIIREFNGVKFILGQDLMQDALRKAEFNIENFKALKNGEEVKNPFNFNSNSANIPLEIRQLIADSAFLIDSKGQPIVNQSKLKSYTIKSANTIKFSKSLSEDFNKILEDKTGISADKVYDQATANAAGAKKGRFKFFIPPSAEDFVGLLYATLGKGKKGDKQMDFYKKSLLNPYAKAMGEIAKERVALTARYKAIAKTFKIAPKNLRKKIEGEEFTREQAVRVYMWNKDGIEIPGLELKNADKLIKYVEKNKKLKDFGDQLLAMQPDGLATPTAGWTSGSIDQDILASLNTIKRKQYLEDWQSNVDAIFSNENLNKLQAIYGKPYRIALENILKRMETGRNRSYGGDALTTRLTNWISNSVGAIMFFNTRSAVLQTISSINFINWSDNNLLAAASAFANQKQYWSDFAKLMNSDFLKDRRGGLKINVNETDIAEMAANDSNKARGVISGLLKLGFLPTQIADSFAIASGGSTFYRNRIKSLMKEGMPKAEAEKQAMIDFSEAAEESQQSSRPDRISQQQAGPLGRMILAFANTPAQYARLTKKAILDLKNRRGDAKANISKIIYYGVAQNIIFTALQQALFATLFDDEEEEKESDKYIKGANSMLDSFLRGIGFAGAAVSVVKNIGLKIVEQSKKKSPKYEDAALKLLDISPPISSKISKLRSAGRIYSWNKKEINEKGLSFDNPANEAIGKLTSAFINLPLDRAIQKADNIQNALAEETDTWQRIALLAGWKDWELGMQEKKKKKSKGTRSRTRTRTRTRTRKRN